MPLIIPKSVDFPEPEGPKRIPLVFTGKTKLLSLKLKSFAELPHEKHKSDNWIADRIFFMGFIKLNLIMDFWDFNCFSITFPFNSTLTFLRN